MERDEAAFTAFVEERKDSLVNYLTHMTRSRDRAEEIAQDAFVRFYRSGWMTREDGQLAPYLFRIATNLAISQLRREKRWQRLMPFLTAREQRHAPPADSELLTDEIQKQVSGALERLPLKFRAPLVLFEIEEWPYEEIARALDCRLGTIKSRISRARALLRRELESWWIGGHDEGQRTWRRVAAPAASDDIASIHI
jgi:RNA polymerase sigma-70 factor, ECF subfamily